jgi:hypothetical protein
MTVASGLNRSTRRLSDDMWRQILVQALAIFETNVTEQPSQAAVLATPEGRLVFNAPPVPGANISPLDVPASGKWDCWILMRNRDGMTSTFVFPRAAVAAVVLVRDACAYDADDASSSVRPHTCCPIPARSCTACARSPRGQPASLEKKPCTMTPRCRSVPLGRDPENPGRHADRGDVGRSG